MIRAIRRFFADRRERRLAEIRAKIKEEQAPLDDRLDGNDRRIRSLLLESRLIKKQLAERQK